MGIVNNEIKNEVERRKIEFLIHFTQCSNLENIFKHGLLPRDVLNQSKISSSFNDPFRYDGYTNAVCLSISFPNYKMFYPIRLKPENRNVDWAVIGIDKNILYNLQCGFCINNAACSSESGVPLYLKTDVKAFNSMFAEYPGKPKRIDMGISTEDPTNPQAEVLVFDRIEVKDIVGVAFENDIVKQKYQSLIPENKECITGREFFYGRADHRFWGKYGE